MLARFEVKKIRYRIPFPVDKVVFIGCDVYLGMSAADDWLHLLEYVGRSIFAGAWIG